MSETRARNGNLMKPIVFRPSVTRHGLKLTTRLLTVKQVFFVGRPPWTAHEPLFRAKRIKGGFKWKINVFGFEAQGEHQLVRSGGRPRPKQREYQCPRCHLRAGRMAFVIGPGPNRFTHGVYEVRDG